MFIITIIQESKDDGHKYIRRVKLNRRRSNKENIDKMGETVVKLERSIERKNTAICLLRKHLGTIDACTDHNPTIQQEDVDTIYCAVLLCDVNRMEAIPIKWVKRFDGARLLNKGLSVTEKYTVFYGPNIRQKPHFQSSTSTIFSLEKSGIYTANILRFFGTFIQLMNIFFIFEIFH